MNDAMQAYASLPVNVQVSNSSVRCGAVSVLITELSKTVSFSSPMPTASYQVILIPNGLAGAFTVSAKTVNGFTMNLPGVAGTVGYIAVQDS